jgi:hypothetical protein
MERAIFCLKCEKKISGREEIWRIYEPNSTSYNFLHDECYLDFWLEKMSKDLKIPKNKPN